MKPDGVFSSSRRGHRTGGCPRVAAELLRRLGARAGGGFGPWCLAWLCLAAALPAWPSTAVAETHIGPLFDEFDLTLAPGRRTEAAGPFYYRQEQETQRIWAVPPLMAYTRDPETESKEFSLIYPVLTYNRYGDQYRWHLFQLLSFAGGPTQTETNRNRITLFPVYFQQRSSDPSQNYTAYGPFYGHLQGRLFRDEIYYVMFPGYSQTKKGGVVTDNYLYPLFHRRHGPGLEGWQFWPIAGHEHKSVTTKTNRFGDVETVGGHDRRFYLWPIYFNEYAGIGTDNPQHQQGFLPAYSYLRSPLRDSTIVLWPLFANIDEREKKYHEWSAPWPLVTFARGEGKTTSRVLPFYSHAASTNLETKAFLWPLYRESRIHAETLDRRRSRILYFLYSDTIDKNLETASYRRRIEQWPFFSYHRDLNGNTRLQVLAVLEPFVPENPSVERQYAPVYSFWRSARNAKTGATSQSLFWNLYRREATPASKRISAFFGLYQSESDSIGTRRRFCFIPLGNSAHQ